MINPVSSCGKKPFGIQTNSTIVRQTARTMMVSVIRRYRTATANPRS
jgi:hypothetical protein